MPLKTDDGSNRIRNKKKNAAPWSIEKQRTILEDKMSKLKIEKVEARIYDIKIRYLPQVQGLAGKQLNNNKGLYNNLHLS